MGFAATVSAVIGLAAMQWVRETRHAWMRRARTRRACWRVATGLVVTSLATMGPELGLFRRPSCLGLSSDWLCRHVIGSDGAGCNCLGCDGLCSDLLCRNGPACKAHHGLALSPRDRRRWGRWRLSHNGVGGDGAGGDCLGCDGFCGDLVYRNGPVCNSFGSVGLDSNAAGCLYCRWSRPLFFIGNLASKKSNSPRPIKLLDRAKFQSCQSFDSF